MADSIVYSNARVKSRESGFLGQEKITRLCHAESLKEAVKILYENNYGGGIVTENPYDYEKILKAEEMALNEFIAEIIPEKSALKIILFRLDFHNAKVFMKALAQKADTDESALTGEGSVKYERLSVGIRENSNILPQEMANAVDVLKNTSMNSTLSPRQIDLAFDKAFYALALRTVKAYKDKLMTKYLISEIDLVNLSVFLRTRRIGNKHIFSESFIDGGTVAYDTYEKLFDQPYDAVYDKLKFTEISEVAAIGIEEMRNDKPLVGFEREKDNYLLNIFKDNRHDIFGAAPMAGYYLAKKYEIKALRTILVCIKNNVPTNEIKDRLRENYA